MRAVVTAVIAAIEAAAVALALFAAVGVPLVLTWWLGFDFEAEPSEMAALASALWQLVHLVPLSATIDASTALSLGLAPEALKFTISLAPLGLTLVTVVLGYRSGRRFAGRGASGAWSIPGGAAGFAAAASVAASGAGSFAERPLWVGVAVPALVYAVPLALGFAIRAAVEQQDWWAAFVRAVQRAFARLAPVGVSSLPERALETLRLAVAGVAALCALGAAGVAIALFIGYVDIITLNQGLQLDLLGAFMLFVGQLVLLPIAWIWSIAWFAGPGFSIGAATTVSPFDTLLGPLPALPLLGAIGEGWGWAGGLAPAVVVALAAGLGALAAGRPALRRASALVAVVVPVCAALLAGLIVALLCLLASGAVGPGRLATTGPVAWQVGGFVALQLAFGLSLGVFARRVDLQSLRDVVPVRRTAEAESAREPAGTTEWAQARSAAAAPAAASPLADASPSALADLRRAGAAAKPGGKPWWMSAKPAAGAATGESARADPGMPTSSGALGEAPETGFEALTEDLSDAIPASPAERGEPAPVAEPKPAPRAVSAPIASPEPGIERAPGAGAEPGIEPDAEPAPDAEPVPAVAPSPAPDTSDPLLLAFSWDAADDPTAQPEQRREGWLSRLRSRFTRD